MYRKHFAAAAAAILLFIASESHAKRIHIGLDLSSSNPLAENAAYANAAAKVVLRSLDDLVLGDEVVVRTFGARNLANLRTLRIPVTRKHRPAEVAEVVGMVIRSIPRLIEESKLERQNATNILAFLEFGSYDCTGGEHILLVTDGIEASSVVDPTLLLQGKAQLPEPEGSILKGCHVTMVGVGQSKNGSWPRESISAIRRAWQTWLDKAGATFTPIVDLM